ncbi:MULTISPECIES: bifunctional RNase H/acid phosphatase [Streptomyces]|uniref:Bifunctional RNase H/acid phosphatase n=1 Tax=Streptomyces lycii TaxID=2654337 RepID=A0ABQ7FFF1_9ACTN|nr:MULTISPECIES: bifunctional RNase H/acid phosphatase [Streptomyces]KAF4406708.1 bifunctional RNase H/acid phosphatase [Streptomyces lycii]PGH50615.1 bifunctional RNase H/acid phosphatase [Streptomyces sp. Ru87]
MSGAKRRFVVEADGGSRGNPGPAGYGAVVLDAVSGEPLAEAAEYIGTATNNVAEYKGLIAGLRAAYALDPDAEIQVRMDSKLVVEQMSGRWKIKHPDMRPLAAEAKTVFPAEQVTYGWIPREKNKHADRLANEAMDAGRRGERWQPGASSAALAAGPRPEAVADSAEPEELDRLADTGPALRGTAAGPSAGETAAAGWGPDLGPPATFVLLRHGETALTPEKRFSGSGGTDPELSAAGRRQAEATAAALAARGTIQAVVSSPLRRCRETADTVARRLGLDVRVDEGIRETHFGAWEGMTFAEVRDSYPDDLDAWLASPEAAPTGGGESFAEVTRRVARSRDKLLARYSGRTVLVVTHVTPVKILVRQALGAPPESLFRMELSAASLSAVAYYADGNASLRLFNETSHLR